MTIYETPSYVRHGLEGLDELIASHVYKLGSDNWNTHATSNTGYEHDLPGAPFTFRAFSWADCVRESEQPEWGFRYTGVPYNYCIDPECHACKPQFSHPESGLKLWWYKHVNRIPESNQDVSRGEWLKIQRDCEDWVLAQLPKDPWK